jgi:hypothetical protein
MKIVTNHLKYRIVASKALADFRLRQAQILMDVAYSSAYRFSETAQTCMAVTYDLWSDCAESIERYLLEMPTGSILSGKDLDNIIKMCKDSQDDLLLLIKESPADLDYDLINLFYAATCKNLERLVQGVSLDLYNTTPTPAFAACICNINSFLQEALFTLQECDHLIKEKDLKKNPAFISVEDKAYLHAVSSCYSSFKERLVLYKQQFDIDEVIIKEYLSVPFKPDGLVKEVSSAGVRVLRIV